MTMADSEVVTVTKSQKRNRRRRQRKNKKATKEADTGKDVKDPVKKTEPNAEPAVAVTKKNKRKGRRGGKRSRGLDIYFGRFRCKVCSRHWDSARVFTLGGTMKVLYRQRCKVCTGDDAWVFPFRLEIIRCSQCLQTPCECHCEECGLLKHKRFLKVEEKFKDDDGSEHTETVEIVDPKFQYCTCENKRKDKKLGDKIDPKKAHLSELCEKCVKGRPCNRAQEEAENQQGTDDQDGIDNEP